MTMGEFLFFSIYSDSIVWFSNPCIISTTTIAKSQSDDPLERKLANDSCPGVSIISRPGISICTFKTSFCNNYTCLIISFYGMKDAPIYYVIPPASDAYTLEFLILSNIFVFPVSTCPIMHNIGHLYLDSILKIAVWSNSFFSYYSIFLFSFFFLSAYFSFYYYFSISAYLSPYGAFSSLTNYSQLPISSSLFYYSLFSISSFYLSYSSYLACSDFFLSLFLFPAFFLLGRAFWFYSYVVY